MISSHCWNLKKKGTQGNNYQGKIDILSAYQNQETPLMENI